MVPRQADASEILESPLIAAARELLSNHAHFRGYADHFVFTAQEGMLTVEGSVPSFYLKQVLQTCLRDIHGVVKVLNRVDVACPTGLSGCSRKTRDRCGLEFAWLAKVPKCVPTCDGTPGSSVGDEVRYASACLRCGLSK